MPAFIKFDGIDGESHEEGHHNWIEVSSFSWGATNSGASGHGGGGGAGKATLQDLHFTATAGKGSPKLFLACCQGKHFATVKFDVVRSSEGRNDPYMTLTLEECMVSSFQVGGDAGSLPMESISINFTKITYRQSIQRPDGSFEAEQVTFDSSGR